MLGKITLILGDIRELVFQEMIPLEIGPVFGTYKTSFWELGELPLQRKDFGIELLLLDKHFLIKHMSPPLK